MNCQPPRGLHPEPTRSTTAASRGINFPSLNCRVLLFFCLRRRRRPQLAERSPDTVSTFANPLVLNQLTRHRREQIVISVDCLETLRSELALHGQCDEEFLPHQAKTDLLHCLLIGKELHFY